MKDKEPEWETDEWHKLRPIFYTAKEMETPPSKLIEQLRSELAKIRGKLDDIGHGYSGWAHATLDAQGAITQTISCLYHLKNEMKEAGK